MEFLRSIDPFDPYNVKLFIVSVAKLKNEYPIQQDKHSAHCEFSR